MADPSAVAAASMHRFRRPSYLSDVSSTDRFRRNSNFSNMSDYSIPLSLGQVPHGPHGLVLGGGGPGSSNRRPSVMSDFFPLGNRSRRASFASVCDGWDGGYDGGPWNQQDMNAMLTAAATAAAAAREAETGPGAEQQYHQQQYSRGSQQQQEQQIMHERPPMRCDQIDSMVNCQLPSPPQTATRRGSGNVSRQQQRKQDQASMNRAVSMPAESAISVYPVGRSQGSHTAATGSRTSSISQRSAPPAAMLMQGLESQVLPGMLHSSNRLRLVSKRRRQMSYCYFQESSMPGTPADAADPRRLLPGSQGVAASFGSQGGPKPARTGSNSVSNYGSSDTGGQGGLLSLASGVGSGGGSTTGPNTAHTVHSGGGISAGFSRRGSSQTSGVESRDSAESREQGGREGQGLGAATSQPTVRQVSLGSSASMMPALHGNSMAPQRGESAVSAIAATVTAERGANKSLQRQGASTADRSGQQDGVVAVNSMCAVGSMPHDTPLFTPAGAAAAAAASAAAAVADEHVSGAPATLAAGTAAEEGVDLWAAGAIASQAVMQDFCGLPEIEFLPDHDVLESLRLAAPARTHRPSNMSTLTAGADSVAGFEGASIGNMCADIMRGRWLWVSEMLVHDLGQFRFKGVAGVHSIVSVTNAELGGRTFPTTIRRGKGEQIRLGRGLLTLVQMLPRPRPQWLGPYASLQNPAAAAPMVGTLATAAPPGAFMAESLIPVVGAPGAAGFGLGPDMPATVAAPPPPAVAAALPPAAFVGHARDVVASTFVPATRLTPPALALADLSGGAAASPVGHLRVETPGVSHVLWHTGNLEDVSGTDMSLQLPPRVASPGTPVAQQHSSPISALDAVSMLAAGHDNSGSSVLSQGGGVTGQSGSFTAPGMPVCAGPVNQVFAPAWAAPSSQQLLRPVAQLPDMARQQWQLQMLQQQALQQRQFLYQQQQQQQLRRQHRRRRHSVCVGTMQMQRGHLYGGFGGQYPELQPFFEAEEWLHQEQHQTAIGDDPCRQQQQQQHGQLGAHKQQLTRTNSVRSDDNAFGSDTARSRRSSEERKDPRDKKGSDYTDAWLRRRSLSSPNLAAMEQQHAYPDSVQKHGRF
eukprot:GHRR01002395.1.p1 GENE.GHRR01002395.1~~GHRR01002395.1.p1  ORF type:complete len:1232 (+),score=492.68 GHRR01002395.1:410-3697(+)